MEKKELAEMRKELRDIHKTNNDGKLEIINFILEFLKKDEKDSKEAIIQDKKTGDIGNEEFWRDANTGRGALQDRIEFELDKLKHDVISEKAE